MPLTNGLVVMTPTSVAKTGTGSTATIKSDGSVEFTSCATLSLNGIFTSAYDNYMSVMWLSVSDSINLYARLRANGTDNATLNSYVYQTIQATGTSLTGFRTTTDSFEIADGWNVARNGSTAYFFGPQLAQPTAIRVVTVGDNTGAILKDRATTHNQSTSYDGLSIFPTPTNRTISGLITVFGFNQ